MKKLKQIPIIFWIFILIFLLRIGYYLTSNDYTICADTYSYIQGYQGDILAGKIDEFRTPVYPYFIKLLQNFTGSEEALYKAVVLGQELLSFVSVIIFYITSKHIFSKKVYSYISTILYGTLPVFLNYNLCLLTESVSISLFMLFFCLLVSYFKKPNIVKNIAISVFTFFLIMLRPGFLFVTFYLLLVWAVKLIFEKENRKHAIVGLILLIMVLDGVYVYSNQNSKQNGFFGLSNVTIINDLDTIIGMGIYDTNLDEHSQIIKIIEETKEKRNGPWYRVTTKVLMNMFDNEELKQYCKCCKQIYWKDYISKKIEQTKVNTFENINTYYNELKNGKDNEPDIYVPFGLIYLFVLVELGAMLCEWINKKQVPWVLFTISMLVTGQLMVIIIGAQAEWQRLFTPVLAFVIISLLRHIEMIKKYCEKSKETI